MFTMHTGLMILLWLCGVAALQFADETVLFVAVTVCAVAACRYAPARSRQLLKRVRYLLLAIVVLFAFFTPGQALFIDFPTISPSREGSRLAIDHIARILAVVFCVALLMQRLSPQRLVGGIYALLRPVGLFGVSAERIAVRILLTLNEVETDAPGQWRQWLQEAEKDEPAVTIHIVRETFGWRDMMALVMAALLIGLGTVIGKGI